MDEQNDEAMVDSDQSNRHCVYSQSQKSGEIVDHKNVKNSRNSIKSDSLKCPADGRCKDW